jgi:hypothetical protein
MLNEFVPQPRHLFWPAILFGAGTLAWVRLGDPAWLLGVALYGLGGMAALWILYTGTLQARTNYNQSMVSVAEAISQLSPDQWQALGIAFPHLRVRWHGKPIEYIDDTDIRLDAFERFMHDSNELEVAPQRLYGDGTLLRRQWHLWIAYLQANDYIIANSASGNHSHLWRGGRYLQLKRFLKEPLFVDLNELDEVTP